MTRTLAIIEDDPLLALDLELLCQDAGWDVAAIARSFEEVKFKLRNDHPDMVISDMELIGTGDGVDAVSWLKQRNPDLKIIFVTGATKDYLLKRIDETCPLRVFSKPVDPDRFVSLLNEMQGLSP
jgi:DNA-binding NarL/FixJ family response regulator